MDYELHVNEVVAENDELIALIEADIAEAKALLRELSEVDDLF